MKGEHLSVVIRSPAFTIFMAAVCDIVVFNQLPMLWKKIKVIKQGENY